MIFLIRVIIFLKQLIVIVGAVILKSCHKLLRFVVYKIIIKIYYCYFVVIKKLGWSRIQKKLFLFLFYQKLAHVIIVVIIIAIIITNLVSKTKDETINKPTIANAIITDLVKSEFMEIQDNEEFIEEFADKEFKISSPHLYLDNSTAVEYRASTVKDILDELKEQENVLFGIQEEGTVVKPDIITTKKVKKIRAEIIEYIVKTGDSVSTIADEFEVSVNTILWENNLSAYSIIRPGDKLKILPVTGITHKIVQGENLSKIADKYKVEKDKIIEINKIIDESKLTAGWTLIIPGGKKVEYKKYVEVERYTGFSIIRNLVKPREARYVFGNKMNWPTEGYRITQYYSWRHSAVDIANKTGTLIYAADAGTIQRAGWSTGYGNNIIIDHGGGKKTRYGHLSRFYVQTGQKVGKGESIGAMGSTGWSTGPHVHFEVIINGNKQNPLGYIR